MNDNMLAGQKLEFGNKEQIDILRANGFYDKENPNQAKKKWLVTQMGSAARSCIVEAESEKEAVKIAERKNDWDEDAYEWDKIGAIEYKW